MCLVYTMVVVLAFLAISVVMLRFKHEEKWAGITDDEVLLQHHLQEDGQIQKHDVQSSTTGPVVGDQSEGGQNVENQTPVCTIISGLHCTHKFYIDVLMYLLVFVLMYVGLILCFDCLMFTFTVMFCCGDRFEECGEKIQTKLSG